MEARAVAAAGVAFTSDEAAGLVTWLPQVAARLRGDEQAYRQVYAC